MNVCKSCGAPIRWIKTVSGKSMPVDAQEVFFKAGGKELFVTSSGAVIHGTRDEENPGTNTRIGYISHFATCPNANKHRKR